MSTSEYMGWIAYLDEKAEEMNRDPKNVVGMNEDDMIGALVGGSNKTRR